MNGDSVVQEWLADECSWKQQTVILVAMRGCDGISKEHPTKKLSRKMRGVVLKDADPSTGFMNPKVTKDELKKFGECIDELPIHYIMHFAHTSAIIGYHPDEDKAKFWLNLYYLITNAIHLKPETKEDIDLRDA